MSPGNLRMATPDCKERRCRWYPLLLGLYSGPAGHTQCGRGAHPGADAARVEDTDVVDGNTLTLKLGENR